MPRWLILTATHILVLSVGFAGGIYLLPALPRTLRGSVTMSF